MSNPFSVMFLVVTLSAFTGLLVAGDPDRQGTLIDIISTENWRMCVCYTFVVKPVVSVETRITRTGFLCHLVAVRGTPALSLVTSPAIWWQSVELKCGSVTFRSDGLRLPKYSIRFYSPKGCNPPPHGNINRPSLGLLIGDALPLHNPCL